MGALDGRVAIITGAGRGLGREHALLFASEGAQVVVNDLGGDMHGEGGDPSAAMEVVEEIKGMGGEAVVNGDNVADWDGAARLVQQAVDTFGDLHILVNNAGILRDRVIINMTEGEWDAVINVHLKGHFCPTRHAATYWREQTKAGKEVNAALVHTTSTSGLFANPGQANYDAAKSGIATFSQVCAKELSRYGVRSNSIAPAARTRLTEATPGLGEVVKPPEDGFDVWDPANVAPFVAYLSTADCPFTGETFFVQGGKVQRARVVGVRRRDRDCRPLDGRSAPHRRAPSRPAVSRGSLNIARGTFMFRSKAARCRGVGVSGDRATCAADARGEPREEQRRDAPARARREHRTTVAPPRCGLRARTRRGTSGELARVRPARASAAVGSGRAARRARGRHPARIA